jgi:hypothetical protein
MSKFKSFPCQYQIDGHKLINRSFKKCHNCGQEQFYECDICNGRAFDESSIP